VKRPNCPLSLYSTSKKNCAFLRWKQGGGRIDRGRRGHPATAAAALAAHDVCGGSGSRRRGSLHAGQRRDSAHDTRCGGFGRGALGRGRAVAGIRAAAGGGSPPVLVLPNPGGRRAAAAWRRVGRPAAGG